MPLSETIFGLLRRNEIDLAWIVKGDADLGVRHQEGVGNKGLVDQANDADPASCPVPAGCGGRTGAIGPDRQTNSISPVPAEIHLQIGSAAPSPAFADAVLHGSDAADEFNPVTDVTHYRRKIRGAQHRVRADIPGATRLGCGGNRDGRGLRDIPLGKKSLQCRHRVDRRSADRREALRRAAPLSAGIPARMRKTSE
jgi:hypothetical protein